MGKEAFLHRRHCHHLRTVDILAQLLPEHRPLAGHSHYILELLPALDRVGTLAADMIACKVC